MFGIWLYRVNHDTWIHMPALGDLGANPWVWTYRSLNKRPRGNINRLVPDPLLTCNKQKSHAWNDGVEGVQDDSLFIKMLVCSLLLLIMLWSYFFSLHLGLSQNMAPWRDVSCPLDCSCSYKTFPHTVSDSSLRTIDCSNAGLRRVPSNLYLSIKNHIT